MVAAMAVAVEVVTIVVAAETAAGAVEAVVAVVQRSSSMEWMLLIGRGISWIMR